MINWSNNLPDIKPKYLAIIQLIKTLIQNNELIPGQRLPSERSLARWFSVDRSTVNRALSELAAQGIIFKKMGSGTFIAETPTLKPQTISINWQSLLEPVTTQADNIEDQLMQARILNKGELIDGAADELPADLIPDIGTFEFDWEKHLENHKYASTGYQPLIDTLGQHPQMKQNIDLAQQTIMVSGGAAQSLLLVLSSLLSTGDAVAFTTPSYFNATAVFQTLNIRTFGVPLNNSNFDIDQLEDTIIKHRIKLLIMNPTFENPTGETLTLSQRKRILSVCQQYQVAVVEDDVFGWLSTTKADVPTLKELAPTNVIYISSMSKLLGKGTRIGWIIAPQAIGQHLLQVQSKLDMIPSMLAQEMVNMVLNRKNFLPELNELTATLEKRRNAVAEIFRKYRPDWQFAIPAGGFYLWVTQSEGDIFNQLLEKNILVKPGGIYGADRFSFRFNVARMNEARLQELGERLAEKKA
ncbi:aminotransferase-like domain-containing protein [Companilactobacillus zhongbaensis]|uniref:aminotransferase-like domain-containing protein n=1 Tax=Companilactobacillus zhongbaensis TaxID=2486009 RepID=UPI000F76C0A6|nr:PLP-dependent aminotransferase family protein [Companilactobacillus zhongbaensis]